MGSKKIKTWVKAVWILCLVVCFTAGLGIERTASKIPFMTCIVAGCICLVIAAIYQGEIREWEDGQLEDADEFMTRVNKGGKKK